MARVDFYVLARPMSVRDTCSPAGLRRKPSASRTRSTSTRKTAADAERLDELLWTFRDGSFVPHGLAGRNDGTEVSPVMIGCDGQRHWRA